ncbi:MAG: hypothetical protein WCD20_21050 [Rhodomicrobium sp.]
MHDAIAVLSGSLGMTIAIVHGYLGETKVVRPLTNLPPSSKRVLHAVMFLSAVYWFLGGAALALSPFAGSGGRWLTALIVAMVYLTAALANLWATRGRHFGWILLSVAGALALFSV